MDEFKPGTILCFPAGVEYAPARDPTKAHVISSGEYSDYSIVSILAAQPGKNFAELAKEFRSKLEPYRMWDKAARRKAVLQDCLKQAGVLGDIPSDVGYHAEEWVFVQWLKGLHGYREFEWDDCNSLETRE